MSHARPAALLLLTVSVLEAGAAAVGMRARAQAGPSAPSPVEVDSPDGGASVPTADAGAASTVSATVLHDAEPLDDGDDAPAFTPSRVVREHRTYVPPVAPSLMPARLVGEIHVGFTAPLENQGICPSNSGCVLQSGGGVGGSVELRRPSGLGWFAGYDVHFLDTNAVYELGVQQTLRVGPRYTAPTDILFHPTFDIALGGQVYGDTFKAATYGGLVEVFSGAEIELSETYALRGGFGLRIFSHRPFRTERDGVRRGEHRRLSEMLFVELGLVFM